MRIAACLFALSLCACITATAAEPRELITFQKQTLGERFFAEGATFGDLNNDQHADIVAGPFWFAGPKFDQQHTIYPPKPFDPAGYSDNFFAYVYDFNADGWNDVLVYGFPGKDASWYQNPQGKDELWQRHVVMEVVDNESPTWADITGDGKPEIVCSTGGAFGYAEPDAKEPTKPWTFHRISEGGAGGKFTHGLGVGDVNNDGRMDLLEKTGWWEQPASLANDPVWKKHPFPFSGPGGAQMYAYDVNGDGRNDVITSLAAHGFGLVWYEQLASDAGEIKFKAHTITGAKPDENPYGVKFAEIHAIDLVDMDGDGLKDIVSGKRWWSHGAKGDPESGAPAVVYWFKLVRGKEGAVEWIPYLIDDDSGVGVQVVAGDFSGDKRPDVVISNKKGTFALTQQVKQVSQEEYDAAQPRRKVAMANGLSPEEAAKAMTVPPGFHVRLCAGEPDVNQPIAMAFDDRGRLWVAEAYSYPKRVPEDQARDRILIFEDTDGDAKFDKRTVFYDKLNLVSGLELGFGGVWVGAAPHLLFIPDKDGDDKPDAEPQVLLDGWGYQDTHETLNAFIWGPDGWLYGCHGVFTHSHVGKPGAKDDERTKINAGIWRYHPTRHEFEVFAEGTSNPWGVDFNDHGHAFATACVIPHLYHIIQGGRYQRQAGQHFNLHTYDDIKTIAKHRHWVGNQWSTEDRSKSDNIGGGHAHAGAMIYQGGLWPKKYHNQLFMNNIHGARLNQDQLAREGSGYVGDAAPDFCFTNDVWSQIIYLTYGPDGNVTMIDWYDRNQCHHGNVEGHDRGNGRIFKICYGEPKKVDVDLKKLSDEELIKLQLHENEWYVRHARRILQERAADKKLGNIQQSLAHELSEAKELRDALRILWTMHVTGALSEARALTILEDANDQELKAWTVQLLAEGKKLSPAVVIRLSILAGADSPHIHLYVASALQRIPLADRWTIAEALVSRADEADDHNLPLMYWYGIEPLVMKDPPRAMKLASTSQVPLVSRYIVRRLAAEEAGYEALLASLGSAEAKTQIWMLEEIVAALKIRANMKAPAAWTTTFDKLRASNDPAIRQQAEYIAVKFGDERVLPQLRQTLVDLQLPLERRKLALDSLLAGKDAQLPALLQGLLDDEPLRLAAINGLAAFEHAQTPMKLIGVYEKLPAVEKQAAISTLVSRPAYVLALLDAIAEKKMPRNDLSAFTVRQLASSNDARVTKRLNEVWGSIRETSADKAAEMKAYKEKLKPAVIKSANLQHGREIYTKTCATCHTLFGSGKAIGPDLTGSNRANLDYLLENVLDPSAVVGKDYQMTQISTSGGRVINGIVKEETDTAVTLQTPTDVVTIAKNEIDERELSKLSLMPDGQLKQMQPEEVRDLVAYLASPAQVPLPGEGPWLDPKSGKVVGALEGEAIKIAKKTGGNVGPQPMGAFKLGKWSGDSHLWWTGGKPSDTLVLEIPVAQAGEYEVFVALTKAIDYGIVTLAIDDAAPTPPIDAFNDGVVNSPPISLGIHKLKAGSHRLTVTITGANANAIKGYMFGLDYVSLARQGDSK